jgi:hypothetical protein
MKTAFTTQQNPRALELMNDIMTQAGQTANESGARHATDNTICRNIADYAKSRLSKH